MPASSTLASVAGPLPRAAASPDAGGAGTVDAAGLRVQRAALPERLERAVQPVGGDRGRRRCDVCPAASRHAARETCAPQSNLALSSTHI